MGYLAAVHLKWGEGTIAPGEPVPNSEPGRDYGQMLRLGQIKHDETAAQPTRAQRPAAPENEPELRDERLPEGVTDLGNGWFQLPDGRKVRRKDIAAAPAEASGAEE